MNDEKQVMKLAAERLLAVANGATLEWDDGCELVNPSNYCASAVGGPHVRIRPPAVAPVPKPSQAVLDACKRLGVEAWKLGRFKTGDVILQSGCVDADGACRYAGFLHRQAWTCSYDQKDYMDAMYWHVRPIAATLPCPPKPTPEQVAAARMPDGRRVKEPTVCEVPNGRAWFTNDGREIWICRPCCHIGYDHRRWIAEPADAVVEPWTRETCPVGSVVVDTDGARCQIAEACDEVMKYGGHRQCTYDWALHNLKTHNGQPCGVAK